jgi:hypothetical protein
MLGGFTMVTRSAKYEYKTIPMPRFLNEFDDELNKLAKDSWEPVNLFIPSNVEEFAFNPQGTQPSIFAIFRR